MLLLLLLFHFVCWWLIPCHPMISFIIRFARLQRILINHWSQRRADSRSVRVQLSAFGSCGASPSAVSWFTARDRCVGSCGGVVYNFFHPNWKFISSSLGCVMIVRHARTFPWHYVCLLLLFFDPTINNFFFFIFFFFWYLIVCNARTATYIIASKR